MILSKNQPIKILQSRQSCTAFCCSLPHAGMYMHMQTHASKVIENCNLYRVGVRRLRAFDKLTDLN